MGALDSAVPSLLLLVAAGIGGLISWRIKSQAEELRAIEERLREDRRVVYAAVLDPLIRLLSAPSDRKNAAKVMESVQSVEYKRAVFDLMLYGGDEVVEAYNEFMQYLWRVSAQGGQPEARETLQRFGKLLLAIRRDLGNKTSGLDEWDMLRCYIRDVDQYARVSREGSSDPASAPKAT